MKNFKNFIIGFIVLPLVYFISHTIGYMVISFIDWDITNYTKFAVGIFNESAYFYRGWFLVCFLFGLLWIGVTNVDNKFRKK